MTTDPDCIFCKILRGELPSTEVNRTDGFVAIEARGRADVVTVLIRGAAAGHEHQPESYRARPRPRHGDSANTESQPPRRPL